MFEKGSPNDALIHMKRNQRTGKTEILQTYISGSAMNALFIEQKSLSPRSTEQQVGSSAIFVMLPLGSLALARLLSLAVKLKMADGARFPVPRFNSHNQHIPRSFSSENQALFGKFQGPPTGVFSSQSTTSSVNTVRRHVPQSFAGQGHKQDNTRRFLPQFPQNHRDIQQHRPPMGLPSSNVHQKPMPESQLTNKDTQLENATGFPTSRQFQVLPRNSQTNVDGKLLQMSNPTSSSSYPPHGQPLLQNNFSQAPSQIPPMAFPVPFSGPISVPPPPVPLPFPTPLPGNIVSPAMPLSVAPIIQPVDVPETKTSEVSSQEWIDDFLKEQGIEKQRTQTSCQSRLKVSTCIKWPSINFVVFF